MAERKPPARRRRPAPRKTKAPEPKTQSTPDGVNEAEAPPSDVLALDPAELAGVQGEERLEKVERPEIVVAPDPTVEQIRSAADRLSQLPELRRRDIEHQRKRAAVAATIAETRWWIAKEQHTLENGEKLDFDKYPFQPDIYRDECPEIVIVACTQIGKTELLVCDTVASAAAGLRVLFVTPKDDKRERLVKTRIDPLMSSVPFYRDLVEQAKRLGKNTDSQRIKHLGDGSIVFLIATADKDFSSQPGDKGTVDEYQECKPENVHKLDNRLSASPYQLLFIIGNPTTRGSITNQNLDWQFQLSDQRLWHVGCPHCKEFQVLNWWRHVVWEKRNKYGHIETCVPRDKEYRRGQVADMRPICRFCRNPMDRLSRDAFWKPTRPENTPRRHGYQLSALYNPFRRLDWLYDRYLAAKHTPSQMADFVQNYLGLPFDFDGTSITDEMIARCCGDVIHEPAFKFVPVSQFRWR